MICKLTGAVSFLQSDFDKHLSDPFIGDVRVRKGLQEARLTGRVWLIVEDAFLAGNIDFNQDPLPPHISRTRGLALIDEYMFAYDDSLLTEADLADSIAALPAAQIRIGKADLSPLLRKYEGQDVVLRASDRPFSGIDFAEFAVENWTSNHPHPRAAFMCLVQAILMLPFDEDDRDIDKLVPSLAMLTAAVNDEDVLTPESLLGRLNALLNHYWNRGRRITIQVNSLTAVELLEVGAYYVNLCKQQDRRRKELANAAICFLESALADLTEEAALYANLAVAIVYAGRLAEYGVDRLIALWDTAISLDPENADYHRYRANVHQALGEEELADECFEKARRLDELALIRTLKEEGLV